MLTPEHNKNEVLAGPPPLGRLAGGRLGCGRSRVGRRNCLQ
jgi:hypothetical protein